jgi:galactokinase
MKTSAQAIRDEFILRFGNTPVVVRSPGRINLIGEHTDYNDGFVLPGAIDKAVYVAIQKKSTNSIRLFASEYDDEVEVSVADVRPSQKKPWTNYILGVVDQLVKDENKLSGFDLVIQGDIPLGAGLSSSAAVECATAFALNEIFNLELSRLDLVKISQKAEHEFAGVKCGIMDQFASMFGKKDHVIKLDCRSLEYEYVPVKLQGHSLVLFDTQVKHTLASSAYNTRRAECEAAVSLINMEQPQVISLRDATLDMVKQYVKPAGANLYNRAHYVVSEIIRVGEACDDLARHDLFSVGKKMFATHEGLSRQYEVSCAELDFLVDWVKENPSVLGARMMGGGFGGCTLNLIADEKISTVVDAVSRAYRNQFNIELKSYVVCLEDGTGLV